MEEQRTKMSDLPPDLRRQTSEEMFNLFTALSTRDEVTDEQQIERDIIRERIDNQGEMIQAQIALGRMDRGGEAPEEAEDRLVRAVVREAQIEERLARQREVIEDKKRKYIFFELNRRKVDRGEDIFG